MLPEAIRRRAVGTVGPTDAYLFAHRRANRLHRPVPWSTQATRLGDSTNVIAFEPKCDPSRGFSVITYSVCG
jgi:hypothetical protein